MKRKIWLLVVLLGFLTVSRVAAQEELPGVWNAPKIKGIRFLPDATYQGNPFLNDVFTAGEINLMDGTKIVDVQLKYNNYRDELIYYNADITTQILVDKISVSSFSLADERGDKHFYIKQTVTGYMPGERYLEVLSEGDVVLLVHRKVLLLTCPVYGDPGKEKSMSYQEAFNYYLYNSRKGFELIKPGKNSLLSKLDNSDQQLLLRKILRKNDLKITDEVSFLKAWNLVKSNKMVIHY